MNNLENNLYIPENNLNLYTKYSNLYNAGECDTYRSSSMYDYKINNNESASTDRNYNLHKLKTFSTEEASINSKYRNKNYKRKKLYYCKSTDNINSNIENIFDKKQKILKEFQNSNSRDKEQNNRINNQNEPIKILSKELKANSNNNKNKKRKVLNFTSINKNYEMNNNSLIEKNRITQKPTFDFNKLFEKIKGKDVKPNNDSANYNDYNNKLNDYDNNQINKNNMNYQLENIPYNIENFNNIYTKENKENIDYENYIKTKANTHKNYDNKINNNNDGDNLFYFDFYGNNKIINNKNKYNYRKIISDKKEKIQNDINIVNKNSSNLNNISLEKNTDFTFNNNYFSQPLTFTFDKNNNFFEDNKDSNNYSNYQTNKINNNIYLNKIPNNINNEKIDNNESMNYSEFLEKNLNYFKDNKINNLDDEKIYINEKTNNNNRIYLKISRFELLIEGNEINLSNYENEKLIKIYEKEIQRLNKKLNEANSKLKEYMKLMINSQTEIYNLKDELNRIKKETNNNNKVRNKIKTKDKNNIIERNEDSFIIKLPVNFKSVKNINENNKNETSKIRKKSILIYENKKNLNELYDLNFKNNINYEIYKKKISKKSTRTTRAKSQPNLNNLGINMEDKYKIERDNEEDFYYSQRMKMKKISNNKSIYMINSLDTNKIIICFDLENKQFLKYNCIDSGNFIKNYLESFRVEESEYNSIFLMSDNKLYIITGRNSDLFYIYHSQKNTINKLCKLNNNHSNGVLIKFKDKLYVLSGKYNKKVEIYDEIENGWIVLNEMNIERSYFSACIIKNKYLFCLFGYNTPTNKYLDTIEFYDINNEEKGWKYLKYKNTNLLKMNICGFMSMNYKNEKIIIFGGINGIEQNPVKKFYQIILGKDFEKNSYVEEINRKPKDIYKNKCYYFSNGMGHFEDENKNNYYIAFDNNYNVHVLRINNMLEHDIYYYSK